QAIRSSEIGKSSMTRNFFAFVKIFPNRQLKFWGRTALTVPRVAGFALHVMLCRKSPTHHANQFYRRAVARSADRRGQRDLANVCALRLLHEHVPHVCAHAR